MCLLTIQNHAIRLLIKALFVILRIDQPVQFHANNNFSQNSALIKCKQSATKKINQE